MVEGVLPLPIDFDVGFSKGEPYGKDDRKPVPEREGGEIERPGETVPCDQTEQGSDKERSTQGAKCSGN